MKKAATSSQIMPIVLLNALPASGKSETRAFLRSLPAEKSRAEFKIGFPTIQVDDYPYVESMRFFDTALQKMGQERTFYYGEYYSLINQWGWGVLIEMLNEDYFDIINKKLSPTNEPAKHMMKRISDAYVRKGFADPFAKYTEDVKAKLAKEMDDYCLKHIELKNHYINEYTPEKTIVFEFARGGGCGSERYPDFFPLPEPMGYNYSLKQLHPEILSKCAMLYIKVTPEQSFAKNLSRAPPIGWTGSTDIFHCVPELVMRCDYGCDDFEWMLKQSDKPNTLKIQKEKDTYYIPVGVLDNTSDLTTAFREDEKTWKQEDKDKMYEALKGTFEGLLSSYNAQHK
ncbi:hypothetical protein BLNAU_8371 [Blattamonas nauphoetae]|uniref:Uncharacterized protein n=1 Tax=Blattamonas nauphoetae TaxID=2049346 RepID=A0ABQ9XZ18_9EUKA|nr:hypothetical protein BLNAU_8371 [Blattamonas nauphoetae]